MLPDGIRQLRQGLGAKDLPGLVRIGPDDFHRQEHHPPGFHIGFQLLALHWKFPLGNIVIR